jgi:hypothetical protein
MKEDEKVLKSLGAEKEVLKELLEYSENKFNKNPVIPEEIQEEPFLEAWKNIVLEVKKHGIESALNKNVPHGEKDIILKNPEGVKLEIYNSIAGPIPVIYALTVEDFEELVIKLVKKGKEFPGIKKTGASFAYGSTNRFIVLSNKPYSNIPAEKLGLKEDQWKDYSLKIRREHECTHYFTKRFLGSSRNNIHDELVADFAGITSAAGKYYANWFLTGMGIDKYPEVQEEGRFIIYTSGISGDSCEILKKITFKAANNIEIWSKTEEAEKMNLKEKILFLCRKNLIELYSLY